MSQATITALIAGGLVVVGAFMAWVEGAPFNSFDVKLLALFSNTATTGPGLGLALLAGAAAIGIAPFAPGMRMLGLLGGLGVAILTLLYIFRLSEGTSIGTALGALGIGTWITLGGGIGALIAASRRSSS